MTKLVTCGTVDAAVGGEQAVDEYIVALQKFAQLGTFRISVFSHEVTRPRRICRECLLCVFVPLCEIFTTPVLPPCCLGSMPSPSSIVSRTLRNEMITQFQVSSAASENRWQLVRYWLELMFEPKASAIRLDLI